MLNLLIIACILNIYAVFAQNTIPQHQLMPEFSFNNNAGTNDVLLSHPAKIATLSLSEAFGIGLSYLHSKDLKTNALYFFERAYNGYSKNPEKVDSSLLSAYYYARSCQYNSDFDKARELYGVVAQDLSDTALLYAEICRQTKNCKTAAQFMEKPRKVLVSNAGEIINTKESDTHPQISALGDKLFFTSNQLNSKDIFFSEKVNGKWTAPQSVGSSINSAENEQITYISPDAKTLLFSRNGDIFSASFIANTWANVQKLPEPINSQFDENHAYMSQNGKTVYFSSNRPNGVGGFDIYAAEYKGKGTYSVANMGKMVNTIYNEIAPVVMPNNTSLYFASEGHQNMGGYDIFKIDLANNAASPQNLGYPVNSLFDEMYFSPEISERSAWYSSVGSSGFGSDDIFKISFSDRKSVEYSVVKGLIENQNCTVKVYDVAQSQQNPYFIDRIADSSFFYVLPKSSYLLLFQADNHLFHIAELGKDTENKPLAIFEHNVKLHSSLSNKTIVSYPLHNALQSVEKDAYNSVLLLAIKELLISNKQLNADISFAENSTDSMLWKKENVIRNYFLAAGIDSARILSAKFGSQLLDNQLSITVLDTLTQLLLFPQRKSLFAANDRKRSTQMLMKLKNEAGAKLYSTAEQNKIQVSNIQTITPQSNPNSVSESTDKLVSPELLPKIVVVENIRYDANHFEAWNSIQNLRQLADFLKDNKNAVVEIGSYTDKQGREKFNNEVAIKRVVAMENFLASVGVDTLTQIKVANYGSSKQLTYNQFADKSFNWDALPFNRRVEIRLLADGSDKLIVKQIDVPYEMRIHEVYNQYVTNETLTSEILKAQTNIANEYRIERKFIKVLPIPHIQKSNSPVFTPTDSIKKLAQKDSLKKENSNKDLKNQKDTLRNDAKDLNKKVLKQLEDKQPKKNLILKEGQYVFSVLLLTADEPVDMSIFSDVEGVRMHKDEFGRFVYYFGEFIEEYMAMDAKDAIEEKYPQAYIFINTYDY